MRIGRLKRWARIEYDAATTSPTGEPVQGAKSPIGAPVEDWQMFLEGPCRFQPMRSGGEKFSHDQPYSEQLFLCVMRWSPKMDSVSTKMRLVDRTNNQPHPRIFDIELAFNHFDRRKEMHFQIKLQGA